MRKPTPKRAAGIKTLSVAAIEEDVAMTAIIRELVGTYLNNRGEGAKR